MTIIFTGHRVSVHDVAVRWVDEHHGCEVVLEQAAITGLALFERYLDPFLFGHIR